MLVDYTKKLLKHWLLSRRFPMSKVHFGAVVDKKSSLGKHTVLFPTCILQNSKVDDYSYIQSSSVLTSVTMGKFCCVASNVHIGLANHPLDKVSTSPVFYDSVHPLPFFFTKALYEQEIFPMTKIESDVWVGQNALIKSGLNIGVGAVIAAGAVVTKDVEAYSVVAGTPAKHIKWRFNQETREQLLKTKWWEKSDEELQKLVPAFDHPAELIKMCSIYNAKH